MDVSLPRRYLSWCFHVSESFNAKSVERPGGEAQPSAPNKDGSNLNHRCLRIGPGHFPPRPWRLGHSQVAAPHELSQVYVRYRRFPSMKKH